MVAGVDELRALVASAGVQLRPKTDDALLTRVLEHVGDVGVASDAILQLPRPAWLRELIGYDLWQVAPRA